MPTPSTKPHASGLTHEAIDQLHTLAERVARNAYSPYSKFKVGAAILLADGSIHVGCNVENASYRLTCCAEQSAISVAVAHKGPGIKIRAVSVTNLNGAASMPCGACRQTLSEFGDADTWVFFPGVDGVAASAPLGSLIPFGFKLAHD